MLKDKIIQGAFWSQLFYSLSYPFIHIWLMRQVDERMLSANSMIICITTIVFNTIWNKYSDKLYKFFPILIFTESVTYGIVHLLVFIGQIDALLYYIIDTILFSLITKNMICCGNKLRSCTYKGDLREKYDNTVMIATSLATLIGGGIALVVNLPIKVVIITSWIGISIDNLFYYLAYKEQMRDKQKQND